MRDLHPDPQHQGADTPKDFFLQCSLVFCRVPHTAKFVQQFIAHYVFVENAKAKMHQHGQRGGVETCAWLLGASCSELVHHRPAVHLLSVKYGKLLFPEPHASFLCVGEAPPQNSSCVTPSKPKIDQTVKCSKVICWIGRCEYANILHSSAKMVLQTGETVFVQDRNVVQHADRHGASSRTISFVGIKMLVKSIPLGYRSGTEVPGVVAIIFEETTFVFLSHSCQHSCVSNNCQNDSK